MKRNLITLGLLASTLVGGAAFAKPVIPVAAPAVEYRRGNDHRWTYLAAAQVDGRRDRDVISLGHYAGRFDRLMLVPQGERVRVQYVTVRFENGQAITQDLRDRGRGDAGSIVIDLPGERRAVQSVELVSSAGRRWGGGNGQIALYGDRGEFRPRGRLYR